MCAVLHLHPLHWQNGSVSALRLHDGVALAVAKFLTGESPEPQVVWAKLTSIQIQSFADSIDCTHCLSLTLAEVKHVWDPRAKHDIISVRPWHKAQPCLRYDEVNLEHFTSGTVIKQLLSGPPVQYDEPHGKENNEFWIFFVQGDKSDTQAVLRQMLAAGAICSRPFDVLTVTEEIGAGSQSIVYHAYGSQLEQNADPAGCKELALKVSKKDPSHGTCVTEFASIQHEVTCMIEIGSHLNIIKFLGIFIMHDGKEHAENCNPDHWPGASEPFPSLAVAMEYMHGGSVFDAVSRMLFKEHRARAVIADALSALGHIHSRRVVHRDVTARNVLLSKDGRAVLTDFGLAAAIDDEHAMSKRCGTPGYIAPEVVPEKATYGIKVDSFGAGALLYFMICGHVPFEGTTVIDVLKQTFSCKVSFAAHPHFSKVSVQCKAFICRLMQKDPADRLSAEQAVSHLWSINDDIVHACNEQIDGQDPGRIDGLDLPVGQTKHIIGDAAVTGRMSRGWTAGRCATTLRHLTSMLRSPRIYPQESASSSFSESIQTAEGISNLKTRSTNDSADPFEKHMPQNASRSVPVRLAWRRRDARPSSSWPRFLSRRKQSGPEASQAHHYLIDAEPVVPNP